MQRRAFIAIAAAIAALAIGAAIVMLSVPSDSTVSPVPAALSFDAPLSAVSTSTASVAAAARDARRAPRTGSRRLAKAIGRSVGSGEADAAGVRRVAVRDVGASTLRARGRELGLRVVRAVPQLGIVVVEPLGQRASATDLAERLRSAGISSVTPATPVYPAVRPNDQYFDLQWGFENSGQNTGTVGADSKATSAWDWSRGDGTVVAVVDTGVDFSAVDLASKAWHNADEIAGNGIDDDSNGYIDDTVGWDYLNDDSGVFDMGDGDQHGTHVAGTAGARTNDSMGAAGMGWNAKIMSLKFLGTHQGSDIDAASAIVYAVDNGADVINASWGGTVRSQLVADAITYAAAHDVLVVAAAGNAGANTDTTPFYPASLPATNIVSVAALDRNDALPSFSNRGATSVDLGAPGAEVLSSVPRWGAGLLVDDAPFKAVYLPFQVESITTSTVRAEVFTKAMAELATATANPVLLVDDSWGSRTTAYEPATRRRNIYLSLLSGAGYSNVTTWSTDVSGTPSAAYMSGKTVVWFTGASTFAIPSVWPLIETHGTLTTAERAQVGAYLDGGGRLLISSGDLAFEMSYLAATKGTLTWFRNYLHARYLADDPGLYDIIGRASTIYDGMSWVVEDYLRYSDGTDDIGPYDGAATVLAVWPHDFIEMNGTSMAAPHVSGTIALMKSRMPALTAAELKQRLLAATDPIASLAGLTVTGGRLDAAEAVGTIDAPADLRAWPIGVGTLQVAWRNPATADFDYTRVLSRIGTDPAGPDDPDAVTLYEGPGEAAGHGGLALGDEVHYAAFSRSKLGGWSPASRLTTVVAEPGPGVPIPVGSDVSVTYQGVTLTFPSVTATGWLSITRIPPTKSPPAEMRWLRDGYYEIHPVGVFAVPVDIDLPYTANFVAGREVQLKVYHDVGSWSDVTVAVNDGADTIRARTASFSEFAIAEAAPLQINASAELPWPAYAATLLALVGATRYERRRRRA